MSHLIVEDELNSPTSSTSLSIASIHEGPRENRRHMSRMLSYFEEVKKGKFAF